MFKKRASVDFGQTNVLSGKDSKNLLKYLQTCFPHLKNESSLNILGLKTKTKFLKVKLPKKVILYEILFDDETKNSLLSKSFSFLNSQVDNKFCFIDTNSRGDIFPLLPTLSCISLITTVEVHYPASKFIIGGADVMLPGIIDIEKLPFKKNEKVAVKVRGNEKPFCFGKFSVSSEEAKEKEYQGKGIVVVHVFLDLLWSVTGKFSPPGFDAKEKTVFPVKEEEKNIKENAIVCENNKYLKLSEDQTNLLRLTFLHAIEKRKIKKDEFPLLYNTFFSNVLLPCRPKETTIELRKTKYKKLSVFLKELGDLGILLLENKDSKDFITGVKEEKILEVLKFQPLVRWSVSDEVGQKDKTPEEHISPLSSAIELTYIYRPDRTEGMNEVFPGAKQKSKYFSIPEIKQNIFKYILENSLENEIDKSVVMLDPVLFHILKKKIQHEENFASKRKLVTVFINSLVKYYQIRRGDGSFSEKRRGDPKKLVISVKRRQGNKHVTKVRNLHVYGVNLKLVAEKAQIKFGCSTSVQKVEGNNNEMEVLIQGKRIQDVAILLTESFGIKSSWIQK
eukprot:snap_masked-scaffold_5-processed-gene-6.7-mRNA-1 protein AED:1.00 eAED:1.00 QI:0/0/0/0/1/1/2/0/562